MAPTKDGAAVLATAYDDTRDSGSRSPASAPSSPDTSSLQSAESPLTFSSPLALAEQSYTPLSLTSSDFASSPFPISCPSSASSSSASNNKKKDRYYHNIAAIALLAENDDDDNDDAGRQGHAANESGRRDSSQTNFAPTPPQRPPHPPHPHPHQHQHQHQHPHQHWHQASKSRSRAGDRATPSKMAAQSPPSPTADAPQGGRVQGRDARASPKCPEMKSDSTSTSIGKDADNSSDLSTTAASQSIGAASTPTATIATESKSPNPTISAEATSSALSTSTSAPPLSQDPAKSARDEKNSETPQSSQQLNPSSPRRPSAHSSRPAPSSTGDAPKGKDSQANATHSSQTSTTIIRPKFLGHEPQPQATQGKPASENPPAADPAADDHDALGPELVRTTSSTANTPLIHPVPDFVPNVRAGAFLGNIAQLEDIAERLSMTSSIEDAIREEHRELKRSDSRRSSILAASVKNLHPDPDPQETSPTFAKPTSIIDINSTARLGGYSPSGFVMSPAHSLSSSRLRSSSKASATGPLSVSGGSDRVVSPEEGTSLMSRHGPGKASVRSVHSNKPNLPEIVEDELPVTLTQDALDEADRAEASGEHHDEDETLRINAYQQIDMDFSSGLGLGLDMDLTPNAESWPQQPMLGHNSYDVSPMSFDDQQTPQQHTSNPMEYAMHYDVPQQQQQRPQDYERPTTSGSGDTYEQTQNAFGDFDGVHCDPDRADMADLPDVLMAQSQAQAQAQDKRMSRPMRPAAPRPQSYFDMDTGQQMLYYPARVPAMLNLPPKLSRKPKADERNVRRSQVLSAMPMASRESRVWLPDPLEGSMGGPLIEPEEEQHKDDASAEPSPAARPESQFLDHASPRESEPSPVVAEDEPLTQEFRRPQKLGDKRKSKMSTMSDIPAALRASAYFDLPPAPPQIEIKNGSAMDTLDSILNASAAAPVSAFTDHAFAGKLGNEVYGLEKKSKKKAEKEKEKEKDKNHLRASSTNPLGDEKKRGSFLSLMGHTKKNSMSSGHRTVIAADGAVDERQRLSSQVDGDVLSPTFSEAAAGGALAPGEDERESSSEEEEEEEEEDDEMMYDGAPTTLLAELQKRKHQQKMRTRPINKAFPNGMHSTLLELDTVAEIERKQRKGKRINLAWEDPNANPYAEGEDDEDVPLGMLYAAKAAGNNDISAVAAEINRPLGLMEKKELEDSEPLSRRRDRLQGRDPGPSMYLGNGLGINSLPNRQSMMTLTPTIAALNRNGALGNGPQGGGAPTVIVEPEEEEVEGESLADRMRRLRAREEEDSPLPLARPVSRAFSAELLSQFGDPEEDKAKSEAAADKNKTKNGAGTGGQPEEEETLGQRRKRLQAEKEARDREMGGLAVNAGALHALTGSDRLSRRLSMADVLGAHPADDPRGAVDPREQERLRREEAVAQSAREKQERVRLARLQAQQDAAAAAANKPSGFMGGRFNDGTGGGWGASAGAVNGDGPGFGRWASQAGGTQGTNLGGGGAGGMMNGFNPRQSVAMSGYGMPVQMPMQQQQMQMPMQFQQPQQQQMMMGGMNGYGYPGGGMNMGMNMNMNGVYGGMGMGMGMGMGGAGMMPMQPSQGQQLDRVERWRQGVQP
ncbi:uncharacterized protein E0L32_006012 [Thyridium curvatum]|uniref:Uncharacterized protein n=1 Tax=Thyridium curvatum TaxID=1093900 RepID=A0A507B904_9PEZI|nr:uncharacterized protein E0L32_006012 [Thyridium curvatum]TPX13541.1 hypothetical protein E0L32_006012 [Thyridium curvatum]